jgi:pyruvate/2-oxoglutarate dehydrogenase complex dihydrolipoamide acyltransferase (E2) component
MIDVTLADGWWKDVEVDAEALLEKWLVAPGDVVKAGDPIAEVALVKTNLAIEAPCDGTIEEILLPEQETFARGRLLARIRPG